MPRQYYSDVETTKSRTLLDRLSHELDFVLVGGWAVNMYTGMQRSKDIDIAIEPDRLDYFRRYGIREYGIGVKYSVIDDIHVDLFVDGIPIRSSSIPVKEMLARPEAVGSIKVVERDALLLLKLSGYFRFDEIKLDKDIVDVLSLLFYGNINMERVRQLCDRYKVDERKGPMGMLEYLGKGARLWDFVCDTEKEYNELAKHARKAIKHAFY